MLDVKVNDVVVLHHHSRYQEDQEVTVTRVGRKYFYIKEGWREEAFSLATGAPKTGHGKWVRTRAQIALAERRKVALNTLQMHGVGLDQQTELKLPLEHVEALAEVAKTFPIKM